MRRIIRSLLGAATAATLAVTLAACEHTEDPPPANPDPTGPTGPPDPTGEPTDGGQQDGAAPPDPGDITPPGTELSFGETAVVPLRDGVVAITVTSIEPGDQALFQSEVDNVEGWVSYHIWVTAENMSEEDISYARVPRLKAVLPGGEATRFRLIGGNALGDCVHQPFPADAGPGTTIETCSLTAVADGETAAGAQWDDRDSGYHDDPIIWWQ